MLNLNYFLTDIINFSSFDTACFFIMETQNKYNLNALDNHTEIAYLLH